jgi:serine/threonine protein kinase
MRTVVDFSLFCPVCRRHYEAERTVCPSDGARLSELPLTLPRPGNVFDSRYVILETVGKGGMATIYRGFDVPNRRQCALKVLKSKFSSEERAVHQFFNEARLASRLQHPNIVRTFDYGRTDVGYLYIAMELLSGETLSRLIRQDGPLDPERAIGIFSQIIDALAEAHARGTIHRDLKPENVFVYTEGGRERIKLLDFGIAQFSGTAQLNSREICGTPAYMSPEQIRGRKASPSSDLYSAGIVLFEMLAGKQPFTGPSPMEILRRQLKMEPPLLSDVAGQADVHPGLEELVWNMMQKKPADRPASAGEVQETLLKLGIRCSAQPRVLHPVPDPQLDEPDLDRDQAIFSFGEGSLLSEEGMPEIVPVNSGELSELLSTRVKPSILLQEPGGIWLDEGEDRSPREIQHIPVVPDDSIRRMADRYTLLHVRFVALEGERDKGATIEERRQEIAEELDQWTEYVNALGGLVCYDSGTDLKILFGYLVEDDGQVLHALEAARSLSLQVEHQAVRQGKRLGVRMGVANGVVFTDQNVEGPLDWLIRGSEIDFAVRLSRLAPIGGVLMCQQTALRAQPEAKLHEMARVNARGNRPTGTFLLKEISYQRGTERADAIPAHQAVLVDPAAIRPELRQ